jgi:hypothetical protein
MIMDALFVELPSFERHRERYLDDAGFRELQAELLRNPTGGAVIEGTGGLRKMRFADRRRGKGKRGGLRVVYYYWIAECEFWLFDLYDKDEAVDLTPQQRAWSKDLLKAELAKRLQ